MSEHHTVLGGKVHVYKRPNSPRWQCSTYLGGKNRRTTTKEDSLSRAKEIAEDWYLQLRGKLRNGEIKTEKTFREASEQFLREYDVITQGQRSKVYVNGQHLRARVTSPSRTGHRQKSRTGPGSPPRNTKSSMKPHGSAHTSRRTRATNGNRNSFTTMFCSRPTPACGPMRRGAFNSGT